MSSNFYIIFLSPSLVPVKKCLDSASSPVSRPLVHALVDFTCGAVMDVLNAAAYEL